MLFDSKKRHKKRIEKRAKKEFGVIKTREDHYYIPINKAETTSLLLDFKKNDMYKDTELLDSIKKISLKKGENVILSAKDMLDDGRIVVQVGAVRHDNYGNMVSGYEAGELIVNSELNDSDRNNLVNMFAYFHRDKDMTVTFLIMYSFKMLDEYLASKC